MKVLLVGQADSIFFEHYTKTIKAIKKDVTFDVFSIDQITGKYDLTSCDNIFINAWEETKLKNIKGLRIFIKPFYTWFSLYLYLKTNKFKYDIIHFKWLTPGILFFPTTIRRHAKKIVATFWGGEFEKQDLLLSKKLYFLFLKNFLKKADIITISTQEQFNKLLNFKIDKNKITYAIYGSSIYEKINSFTISENKNKSKEFWNINSNKITISIGYSGKAVHQHIPILESLFANEDFISKKDDYIFILPLTHGGTSEYYSSIIDRLENVNAKYLMLTQKMTDSEVARLRIATDIMLQLSIADGRSASVIESLLAGSILISGRWLPYQVFRENEIYFYELESIDSLLPETILKISKNIIKELEICKTNKAKWSIETWEKVSPNWIGIYEKVLNSLKQNN